MTTKQIIEEAIKVVRPKVFGDSEIGMVGCALITDKNTIFKGNFCRLNLRFIGFNFLQTLRVIFIGTV